MEQEKGCDVVPAMSPELLLRLLLGDGYGIHEYRSDSVLSLISPTMYHLFLLSLV